MLPAQGFHNSFAASLQFVDIGHGRDGPGGRRTMYQSLEKSNVASSKGRASHEHHVHFLKFARFAIPAYLMSF
jgi:hypothetical protein